MKNFSNLFLLMAILAIGCTEPSNQTGGSTEPMFVDVPKPPTRIEATQTSSPTAINDLITVPGNAQTTEPSDKTIPPAEKTTKISSQQKIKVENAPQREEIKSSLESQYGNVDVNNVQFVKPPIKDSTAALMSDADRIKLLNTDVRKQLGKILEISTKQYRAGTLSSRLSRTSAGVEYIMVKEGTGVQALDNSFVAIKYLASNMDGEIFEENMSKNGNLRIKLGKGDAVLGLEEGIKTMRQGGNAIFFVPPNLAYGDRGRLGVAPNSKVAYLVFLSEVN